MTLSTLQIFLKTRDVFYHKNKHRKYIWYTSLVTGNFRNTMLYNELSGEHQSFKSRPLWGFIRYCLMDLPFCAKYVPPKTQQLIATVFIQQNDKTISEAFFGELLPRLMRSGNKVTCIGKVAHHFKASAEDMARENLGEGFFCPSHLLTKWDGIRCIVTSLFSFISYLYPKEFKWILVKNMLQSHISEVLSALLYEAMIKKIMAQSPDIHILHPLEGNSWESACSLSGQYCIGYQHSSILNDQYKISNFSGRPIPSKIITTGPQASKQLSEIWGYPSDILVDGCSLRQAGIYGIQPKIQNPTKINCILLLMQGNEHQNGVLDILQNFMKLKPDVKVSLRPHPAAPISKMGIGKEAGFSISSEPDLYTDILHHDVCLYVSSTASLESLYLGVPVIHLVVDTDIDSDPLSGVSYLKRDAKSAKEIIEHLQKFTTYPCFDEEFVLAREYFEGYFSKPNNFIEERFKEWLTLSSAS